MKTIATVCYALLRAHSKISNFHVQTTIIQSTLFTGPVNVVL